MYNKSSTAAASNACYCDRQLDVLHIMLACSVGTLGTLFTVCCVLLLQSALREALT